MGQMVSNILLKYWKTQPEPTQTKVIYTPSQSRKKHAIIRNCKLIDCHSQKFHTGHMPCMYYYQLH